MDKSKKLGTGSIGRLLTEFSLPAIVGMMVSALYNVIDRIFIGNSVGSLGIAGITIAFPIMIMQMAFGALIGMGATANISIKLGQGDRDGARKIAGNAFVLLIITSLLFTILGLVFLDPMLSVFGASAEVLPYAHQYMSVILPGTLFMMLGFGLNNVIRAEGKPVTAMITMLLGTLLNIILAPIFIFCLHWGMYGAALATDCAQAISALWIVMHFTVGGSILKLTKSTLRLRLPIIKEILLLGVSAFVMESAQCALTAVMNIGLKKYGGDTAISGMGIINSLTLLMILPAIGINQGAQPIIGYNYGAQKISRVKKTLKYAIITAMAITTAGFILTHTIPAQLIAMFDSSDAALIQFGSHALFVFLICMPIVGFQIAGSGYFQAVGKPRQSMILSLSRQVILLIPLLIILPNFMGINGILFAGPISDFGSAAVTAVWLAAEMRSTKNPQPEKPQADTLIGTAVSTDLPDQTGIA